AVSPESAPIVARLRLGVLIIPQKPWDTAVRELDAYRAMYRELNRSEAPPPLIASFVACHEDEERAREMLETHVRRYCRSTLEHYEFANAGLATVKGYEYYGALSRNIEKHGEDRFVQFLADLQVWGTPDQVYERICEHERLALEKRVLFRAYPLLVGLSCRVAAPGDWLTDDDSGMPILVVRTGAGTLRAFANVCRHRGARVVDGCGSGKRALSCPYHGWTYGLDGRLIDVPGEEGFAGLSREEHSLRPLPVVEKYGLVWVRPAPTAPEATIDID